MAEIISDLRDDLLMAFAPELGLPQAAELADLALEVIARWCGKEPSNDNDRSPYPPAG